MKLDWLKFWSVLVSVFGISPKAAWKVTPNEFWALIDQRAEEREPTPPVAPMLRKEMEALEMRLLGDNG